MLDKIAAFAEAYLAEDPNGFLTKTRQRAEIVAKRIAIKVGLLTDAPRVDILKQLEAAGAISGEITRLFHAIRKAGNVTIHGVAGDHEEAETTLKMAHSVAVWFLRAYVGQPTFQARGRVRLTHA